MSDMFSRLNGGEFLGLCAIIGGFFVIAGGIAAVITKIVASHYRRTQLDEMEATLKMEMVQRGMTADDITRVLDARMSASRSTWQELLRSLPAAKFPQGLGKEYKKT
jgi:hypothetical protein